MSDHTLPLFSLQPETREIPLTRGLAAIVDAADYPYLSQFKWHACLFGRKWYAARKARKIDGTWTSVLMHREILDLADPSILVDHKDNNGLNNARLNLRPATQQQNLCNRPATRKNTSGYKGVFWHKKAGKWMAQIKGQGKLKYLGLFLTREEAAAAYDAAAQELHGEFASPSLGDGK